MPAGTQAPVRGSAAEFAVRPELIAISTSKREPKTATTEVDGVVLNRIFLGEHTEYLVNAGPFGDLLVLLPKKEDAAGGGFAAGDKVLVGWAAHQALVLGNN